MSTKRKVIEKPLPLSGAKVQAKTSEAGTLHPLICPFSGQPMEIRMVGEGVHFMLISPHGFTSKLMKTRDECMEWASTRLGVQTYKAPRIEVRHLDRPDTSAEDGLREIAPDPDSFDDNDLPESLR